QMIASICRRPMSRSNQPAPTGNTTLSLHDALPISSTRIEVARAYAISRLGWIRDQQHKLRAQARETPRQYIERESHYVWGRRYLDRKSTRLNSSHVKISYAVFCLKKKCNKITCTSE